MTLLNKTSEQVNRNTYTMQHEDGAVFHYIEYIDVSGHVIDEELRTQDGISIQDDSDLVEEIHSFVDEIEA